VLTGPESCGKTTLAQDLSGALGAPLVAECSRPYLQEKMAANARFHYREADLLAIAQAQQQAEQAQLVGKPDWVVCDTDLLVIIVWSEVRFGHCHGEIVETFLRVNEANPRHYLLCDSSIPWEPDPLRENPKDRAELFALYEQKLAYFDLHYTVMRGDKAQRLEQALALIDL